LKKRTEKFVLGFLDFIAVNLAFFCYYVFRVHTGWFALIVQPDFWAPMLIIALYWMLIFLFLGLYRTWFASSRFDEISTLFKATFMGVFVLFFLVFVDDTSHGVASHSRLLIVYYWGVIFCFVSFFRLLFRAIQRNLLIKGIGCRNTLIVGVGSQAIKMYNEIKNHPGLGLSVTSFLQVADSGEFEGNDTFHIIPEGGLTSSHADIFNTGLMRVEHKNFEDFIEENDIKELVFVIDSKHDDVIVDLIARCEGRDIGLMIMPNLYEILSGQARTTQLYSIPLIDINPKLMPAWEEKAKRMMDVVVAILILFVSSPVIFLAAIAIKLDSKGPIFYRQIRCGLNGKPFKMVKFRSMRQDAEKNTGPVWSQKNDPRITRSGRFIRKVRIDEIPQMWNVLKGEMSLIGPRPERPFFVEQLSKEIPYYKRRLSVRPGVTGWAQVSHKYDESIEDVREKVRYDLIYIENMSLRTDFKIMLRTVLVVLFGKGHYD
jgi:exopolysaccharide biosynthesis polyprenyl glycosylphosphotransferase